jgi:hypothetical protein
MQPAVIDLAGKLEFKNEMRSVLHWTARLAAGVICLGIAGCQTQPKAERTGGVYVEISHKSHTFLPGDHPARISLNHQDADGHASLIWPSLYCKTLLVKDNTALFVADKSFLQGGEASIHPRLFAVKFPGLPVDITREVLGYWAAANGKDFGKTLNRFTLAVPEEKDNGVALHLEFWSGSYLADEDWPETGELMLSWPEVTSLMRSVQTKGLTQKDPRWHTEYIGQKD